MEKFDFIPGNNVRTEPDMEIVTLFLKAIMKKGYYYDCIRMDLTDRLSKDGTFIRCSIFSKEYSEKVVSFLPCDMEYAWKVLKEKGYHLRIDRNGSWSTTYAVDRHMNNAGNVCGYYKF